jgi:hypothetical protein
MKAKLPAPVRALCAVLALAGPLSLGVIWSDSGPFANRAGPVPLSILAIAITGHTPFNPGSGNGGDKG